VLVDQRVTLRELLRTIGDERARLDGTLARLTADQIQAAGLENGWSVKDILVHISFWERDLLNRLDGRISHYDEPAGLSESIVRARRGWTLAEVLDESGASYAELMARLVDLSDEELNRPPFYRPWLSRPLWRDIASETYEHYWEHTEPLRVWLARGARARRPA
jgi:uncharacterized protein (TIGR03083 family)